MAFLSHNLASFVSQIEKTVDKALNITEDEEKAIKSSNTSLAAHSESELISSSEDGSAKIETTTSESQTKESASEDEFFGQFLGNQKEKTPEKVTLAKPKVSLKLNRTLSDQRKDPISPENKKPINGVKSHSSGPNSPSGELNNSHEMSQDHDHPKESNLFSKEEANRLQEILTQRENQILSLNQENMQLNEKLDQISQEIETYKNQNPDLESLKLEFGKRLSETEKQLHEVCKERDQLRQKLKSSDDSRQKDSKIAELEESNTQLIKEGEKLAQEQAKDRKKIKDMKAKETILEKQKEDLNHQLQEALEKMEILYSDIKSLERYKESGLKVQEIGEIHARKVSELEAQIKEAEIRESTLKSSLERAYKDITDLRKINLDAMEIAHSEALDKEIKKNEEMHEQLRMAKREYEEKESLVRKELFELRSIIQRNEDQFSWREENLRREISNLQEKVQQAETRNEELVGSLEEISQPLMRQIESLQNQSNSNFRVWQQTESSLHLQLQQAISEKAEVIESSKILNEKIMELSSKFSAANTQLSNEKKEKTILFSDIEALKDKVSELEKKLQEMQSRLESERAGFARTLQEVRSNDQRAFVKQLQDERLNWEKKIEEEVQKVKSLSELQQKKDNFDANTEMTEMNRSSSSINLNLNLNSVAMEKMVSNIRVKEDELLLLREEIKKISEIRDNLAAQLLRETEEKDKLLKESELIVTLKTNMEDTQRRHNVALDLLGEKTEELEELRSDMQQLKQVFREQVSQLLDEIETLKGQK